MSSRTRRHFARLGRCFLAVSVLIPTALAVVAGPARADYSATTQNALVGDGDADDLVIDFSGGNLRHNRFSAGDAGFESDLDFDSDSAGVQTLPNLFGWSASVDAGGGNDSVVLGSPSAPAGAIAAGLTLDGGSAADTDSFTFDSTSDSVFRHVGLDGSSLYVSDSSPDFYVDFDFATFKTGSAADTVSVLSDHWQTVERNLILGDGDDTVKFADTIGLARSGMVVGGDGVDTLDYSSWANGGVSVNLGQSLFYEATLTSDQENPPTGSAATGRGFLRLNPGPVSFDTDLYAAGIATGDINMTHIHSGAPGVNGPVVFDLLNGAAWQNTGSTTSLLRRANDSDSDITEAALNSGERYFNIHTNAFQNGEIRGQIKPAGFAGFATDTPYVAQIENLIGGLLGDTLIGDANSNTIHGGSGNDQLDGRGGDDDLHGDSQNDRMLGGRGADTFNDTNGIDRVLFDDHTQGVQVDIDNNADDGNEGEDAGDPGSGIGKDNVTTAIESVTGSPFDDNLTGSCANNTLAPVSGEDTVNGDPATCPGPDTIPGNDDDVFGNDFTGGNNGLGGGLAWRPQGTFNGNDDFHGQGGTDSVTYTLNTSSQGIVVIIDGGPGQSDGLGAVDNLDTDIETVYGGAGADTIDATAAAQGVSLFGRDNNDHLTGSLFDDFLDGEAGTDELDCLDGDNDMHRGGEDVDPDCETDAN